MKVLVFRLLVALSVSSGVVAAASRDTQDARPVVIVVVGAPGADEYAAQFSAWAGLWEQACEKANVRFVAIGLDDTPTTSDRDRLQQTLAEESGKSEVSSVKSSPSSLETSNLPLQTAEGPPSALWLVLIGHGTFDGKTARFNLRGPDVSDDDLAAWFQPISRPVAIVNTASSSAPFLSQLSAPGRIVITATKSGFEQNYARFGQYLAEAIAAPAADLDKDGQTSLLEAFLTASHRTTEFYSAAGRLATEHALLDDNGDALGTPADWFRGIRPVQRARDGAALDGYRAHQLCLLYSQAEADMPPALRAERDRLELEVMQLRDTKDKLPEDEYYAKLEALLKTIARIYEQADARRPSADP